jgi:hypothetical protein
MYEPRDLEEYLRERDPYNLDALDMPVELAGSDHWQVMDHRVRSRVLGGLARNLLKRTIAHNLFYRELYGGYNVDDIFKIEDLFEFPVLSKDDLEGTDLEGFRQRVIDNPDLLMPDNLDEVIARQEAANSQHSSILDLYGGQRVLEFGSGGSQGQSTKTRLSYLHLDMEAHALARSLKMNGFKSGQRVMCLYNETHKGGVQLRIAAALLGQTFFSRDVVYTWLKSNDFTGHGNAVERKGLREFIKEHKIQVIEAVEPPKSLQGSNAKGGGLTFMEIYDEGPPSFESVEHTFLTGFPVPEDVYSRLRSAGIDVSTTWGSTEMMALGTSANSHTNVNHLIETPFPTVGALVTYDDWGERPRQRLVNLKSSGFLVGSSLIGAGTTYVNLFVADKATRTKSGVMEDIDRMSYGSIAGACGAI